jgi:alpha-L-rhamnosidase
MFRRGPAPPPLELKYSPITGTLRLRVFVTCVRSLGKNRWMRGLFMTGLALAPLAWVGCVFSFRLPPPLAVADLRCDGNADPLGIDGPQPMLGWTVQGEGRARSQTAWQILVASDPAKLSANQGDLWDSGRTASMDSAGIRYAGARLASAQQVYWKVRTWDERGRPSPWSSPASWTMGLLSPADWGAQWLTDGRCLWWDRSSIGFRSEDSRGADAVKWVEIDLGTPQPLDAVRMYPMPYGVPTGLGFPSRFKIDVASNPDRSDAVVIADFSTRDYPSPGIGTAEFPAQERMGRYVRITATGLPTENDRSFLALSQVEVISQGRNIAEGADIRASDSRESAGWALHAATDGLAGSAVNPYANATLLLRREFAVRPGLRRALVFVCGLGDCQMTVNGKRTDEDFLTPGWTDYAKTRLYSTRDITGLLSAGPNALGLNLASGMFNVQPGRYVKFLTPYRPLQAIANIRLEYQDGSVDTIVTAPDWKVHLGPATFANVYGGEDYDARLAFDGWDKPNFDDRDWAGATAVSGISVALHGASYAALPVRLGLELDPVSTHRVAGSEVYDLGQNTALIPQLRVHGPAGSIVRITPAELLAPDGSVSRSSVGRGDAYWQYTLRGVPEGENWAPHAFYHGCRYLQVQCLAGPSGVAPVVDAIAGRVLTAATVPAGDFECSNPLFNRIHALVRWSQLSNTVSVLTDCPHRERLGWLEQTHLNGPALRYEFDLDLLFGKIARDIRDAQADNGFVPDIAPEYVRFADGFRDSPEWGSASVLVPWQSYEWTGDADGLRQAFGSMKAYVGYLSSRANSRGLLDFGLGDWYDLGPGKPGKSQLTPVALTATAYFYRDARILADAANVLGSPEDARRYATLAGSIYRAFNQAFFDSAAARYATGSQCSDAIALVFGLVPAADRARVQSDLVADIKRHGDSFTAGDIGYGALLRALADAGRSDVIYTMNNQSSRPGYGYQLAHGATSLTEAWDANPRSSQDHFMLGQINEWFYHDLAGISLEEKNPGFRDVVIKPAVVGDLTWVRAHYDSIRGRISSQWNRNGSRLALEVDIPANVTATVYVPSVAGADVTEGGVPVQFVPHVKFLNRAVGAEVFSVGSGHYRFESEIGPPAVPAAAGE